MSTEINANRLYQRAEEEWRRGKLQHAFRFFLAAAQAGMTSAFGIVGQFYDFSEGVRTNENEALRWYRRAHRNGDYSVANNVGCILRDKGKPSQALRWFRRAIKLGDADANLKVAKLYLRYKNNETLAIHFLKKTCQVSECYPGIEGRGSTVLRK